MGVVAITGDDLVTLLQRGLDPGHDGFLANIEVTEAGNQTHAVKLTRLFLETAHHQHLAIVLKQLVFSGGLGGGFRACGLACALASH